MHVVAHGVVKLGKVQEGEEVKNELGSQIVLSEWGRLNVVADPSGSGVVVTFF